MTDEQYRPSKAFDFTDASDEQTAAHTDAPPDQKLRAVLDKLEGIADYLEGVLEGKIPVEEQDEPLEELIARADADPLLQEIPDEQTMQICISRAKILCWLFEQDGPDLTEAEDRFYRRLSQNGEIFLFSMQRLLYARFDASEDEIMASTKHDLTLEDIRVRRTVSLAKAFLWVPEHELDECMQKTAEVFNDGMPFTCLRHDVMLALKPEDLDEHGHLRRVLS